MLKKYTKYAATALAVASLSTFIIGCGGAEVEDYTTPDEPMPTHPETSDEPEPGKDGPVAPAEPSTAPGN